MVKKIGDSQFGSILKSYHKCFTQHGSFLDQTRHHDGTGSTVRVVLFDYRKTFDLINHTILVGKLMAFDIPHGILCWIIDFLKDRKQRVKLEQDCKSEKGDIPGIPAGIKLRPWLFILMHD